MGGGRRAGGGGVPVVLVAEDVSKLETALDVVNKNGYVNTSEVSGMPPPLVCLLARPNACWAWGVLTRLELCSPWVVGRTLRPLSLDCRAAAITRCTSWWARL